MAAVSILSWEYYMNARSAKITTCAPNAKTKVNIQSIKREQSKKLNSTIGDIVATVVGHLQYQGIGIIVLVVPTMIFVADAEIKINIQSIIGS